MLKLISKADNTLMKDSSFVKNATLYKDMFAFYDAYAAILQADKETVPNYCYYNKGAICLEGICLFMKDYASELGFESVSLSLDYLKVIYYTLASYSKDGVNMPERSVIENEFKAYIDASKNSEKELSAEFEKKNKSYLKQKKDYDGKATEYSHKLVLSRILDGLAVVMIIMMFAISMLFFSFYFLDKFSLTASIISSSVTAAFGIVILVVLKKIAKKIEVKANELAYDLQTKKKNKDAAFELMRSCKRKLARVVSERYEFEHNFSKELTSYYKSMSFDALLSRASEYKLLSYNLKLDIENLFVTQDEEIKKIISKISKVSELSSSNQKLSEIYTEIVSKDWLEFSNEVRFEFLKKFIGFAGKTHYWKLEDRGSKIDPFGIDVKALAKEQVAYLKSTNDLFVAAYADKLLMTSLIKSERELEIEAANDSENIYNVKLEYLKHFFDYNKTSKYNNLFYGKSFNQNAKVTSEILDGNSKIPSVVQMNLKLTEQKHGLANCQTDAIKKISSIISGFEKTNTVKFDDVPVVTVATKENKEIEIEDYAEKLDDYGIEYHFGDNVFVGYKLGAV